MPIRVFSGLVLLVTAVLVAGLAHGCGSRSEIAEVVRRGDTDALVLDLLWGADPNARIEGGALLYVATGPKGGLAVTRVLLEIGADPERGSGDYTPLMNAASWGRLETCKLLVAFGADPARLGSGGQTAADVAGKAGHAEIRAYLAGISSAR